MKVSKQEGSFNMNLAMMAKIIRENGQVSHMSLDRALTHNEQESAGSRDLQDGYGVVLLIAVRKCQPRVSEQS